MSGAMCPVNLANYFLWRASRCSRWSASSMPAVLPARAVKPGERSLVGSISSKKPKLGFHLAIKET